MLFDSTVRRELARTFGACLVVILTIVLTMFLIRTLGQAASGKVAPQDVILLLGSLACFSVAMQKTGLAEALAGGLLESLRGWPPYAVLLAVFVLALRRAPSRQWLALAGIVLGLAAAYAAVRPTPGASNAAAQLQASIGSGTPVLVELQSPY